MDDRLSSNISKAWALLDEDRGAEALALLSPDRDRITSVPELAEVWLALSDALESDQERISDARGIAAAFRDVPQLIWSAANVLVGIAEERPLDLPAAGEGTELEAAELIRETLRSGVEIDDQTRSQLYVTLGAALRMIGYDRDVETEDAFRRAIEINDHDSWAWFNAGIFYKWRGRWAEGLAANRRTLESNPRHEGALWNLAVCATACGDTFTASEAYLQLGLESRPGTDGLPSMTNIGPIKLRVSLHGAGIDANAHDPAREAEFEHIWVAARSACHGEVISASLHELPVDYGDIVLWDPAPVAYQKAGDLEIPMFPLLARLKEGEFHRLWFVAEQSRGGLLREIGADLPNETALYVLDEQIQWLCATCSSGEADDEHVHEIPERRHVTGKLLIPKTTSVDAVISDLTSRLDAAGVRLACPDLFLLANDEEKAASNDQLWNELMHARAAELGLPQESEGLLVEPVRLMTRMHAIAIAAFVAIVGGGVAGLILLLGGQSDAEAIRGMLIAQAAFFIVAATATLKRSAEKVCSNCAVAIDEISEHCSGCGGAFGSSEPPAPVHASAAPIGEQLRADRSPIETRAEEEAAELVN